MRLGALLSMAMSIIDSIWWRSVAGKDALPHAPSIVATHA